MKRLIALLATAALVLLAGCQGGDTQHPLQAEGSRRQPLTIGKTIVYEGLDTNTEYGAFRMKLQLLDAIRGGVAGEIYLADSETNRATDIPPDKELLIAKLSVELLESKDNTPVALGKWAQDMFLLVSERGETYPPLSEYGQVRSHLFAMMEPGEEQVGHLFFVVDRADSAPTFVFMPDMNAGVWFDPAVREEERGPGRIDPADWGLDSSILDSAPAPGSLPDAADPASGGTMANPLPMGEWGVLTTGAGEPIFELEMMLTGVERAEQAMARVDPADLLSLPMDPDRQELLAVQIRANLLTDELGLGVNLNNQFLYAMRENGELIGAEQAPELYLEQGMWPMFRGSSQEGWVIFVVDKGENLRLSPAYSSVHTLWFSTDPSHALPEGLNRFDSRYTPDMASERFSEAPYGSMDNPVPMGQSGYYYSMEGGEEFATGLSVRVLGASRGGDAEQMLSPSMRLAYQPPEGIELLCVRVEVTLNDWSGPDAFALTGDQFLLVSSGRVASGAGLPGEATLDSPAPIRQGETAEGNLLFYVDTADLSPTICYPRYFSSQAPPTWFELAAYSPAQAI